MWQRMRLGLTGAIQGIITQNFPFYTFQDVDLKGGETEIPDELDGLLVTQPGKTSRVRPSTSEPFAVTNHTLRASALSVV